MKTSGQSTEMKFGKAFQSSSLASRRMKMTLSIKTEELNETMMKTGEIPNMEHIMAKNDEEYDEEEENIFS